MRLKRLIEGNGGQDSHPALCLGTPQYIRFTKCGGDLFDSIYTGVAGAMVLSRGSMSK